MVFVLLEYRATLYSRLENRRKKKELRAIREQARPLQERKVIISCTFIRHHELLELKNIYSAFHGRCWFCFLGHANLSPANSNFRGRRLLSLLKPRTTTAYDAMVSDVIRSDTYMYESVGLPFKQFTNPFTQLHASKIHSLDNHSVWQRIISWIKFINFSKSTLCCLFCSET